VTKVLRLVIDERSRKSPVTKAARLAVITQAEV
jgi:hypothetical protein